jgi:hypothetical protein
VQSLSERFLGRPSKEPPQQGPPSQAIRAGHENVSGWEPAHYSSVEDSAVIALAEVALAVGSGADGNNLGLEFASNFPYNQKTQSTH